VVRRSGKRAGAAHLRLVPDPPKATDPARVDPAGAADPVTAADPGVPASVAWAVPGVTPESAGSGAIPAGTADPGVPASVAWAVPGVTAEPAGSGAIGRTGSPRARNSRAGNPPAGSADEGDPEVVAQQICLRMLTAAPRTRAQLAEALQRRGVPQDAAEAVLGRLGAVKLIDDAAFAAAWVESRHHGRGLSGRALAAELTQRGVSPDDIKAAVGRLDPEQEIETARGLVARRLASTRGQPLQARIRRLTGLLARKGYSAAIAYRVVREALEQEGLDPAAAGIDLDDPPEAENDVRLPSW
jgi:regulatory protein